MAIELWAPAMVVSEPVIGIEPCAPAIVVAVPVMGIDEWEPAAPAMLDSLPVIGREGCVLLMAGWWPAVAVPPMELLEREYTNPAKQKLSMELKPTWLAE
jgi:hypothetical protein